MPRPTPLCCQWMCALLLAAGLLLTPVRAQAQMFHVDFSHWAGPPLVKDKFGVYQTPFFFQRRPPSSFDMTGLLREAGVRDLRYEMGWGKPDTYAFDQIQGTPTALRIDWARLDPFVGQLRRAGVSPLFAMTYDPLPLKTGTEWPRWKDAPGSLAAWREINRRYAAHYRALGLPMPRYEIWNEPDLPGDGGKVFFNGGPDDYARVAQAGFEGVRAGDEDAQVGGPAIAWQPEYARPLLSGPIDFLSIHAYGNYPAQVGGIARGLAASQPGLPILLTEYASYTNFGLSMPSSRHGAAARFFRDVRGMLALPDLAKVYWAQWIDDSLGMVTSGLHRKALFNAYKIYQTLLPVDRNSVSPDGQDGVGVLAASDDHAAGVVVWNENPQPKTISAALDHLPFARGWVQVYRIDATHASYIDNHASENLAVTARLPVTARAAAWSGTVPAEGVVFLRALGAHSPAPLHPVRLGTYLKSHFWFPDRRFDGWADFDPRASIVRLGMGSRGRGTAQIGCEIDRPAPRWNVQVRRSGPFAPQSVNAVFGLRVDYGSRRGGYGKSILWHDGSYQPARTAALPWGRGDARPDEQHLAPALLTGAAFAIDIAKTAPPDWNHRVIVTPILQEMGAGSQVRMILRPQLQVSDRLCSSAVCGYVPAFLRHSSGAASALRRRNKLGRRRYAVNHPWKRRSAPDGMPSTAPRIMPAENSARVPHP